MGIGTVFPNTPLDVIGSQPPASASFGTPAAQVLDIIGGKGGNTTGTTNQKGGSGASIYIQSGSGGDAPAGSVNGDGGILTIQGGGAGSGAGVPGNPGKVLLNPSYGNVGIGTVSPSARLEVVTTDLGATGVSGSAGIRVSGTSTFMGVQGLGTGGGMGIYGKSAALSQPVVLETSAL